MAATATLGLLAALGAKAAALDSRSATANECIIVALSSSDDNAINAKRAAVQTCVLDAVMLSQLLVGERLTTAHRALVVAQGIHRIFKTTRPIVLT
jgi:hypothetical protein